MLEHFFQKEKVEAGCDEAGRGCLAGPVVAASVIIPPSWNPGLDDSKKLSEKKRSSLALEIKENAIAWGVGVVGPSEIDEINILNASFVAMHRAIESMNKMPQFLIIDGNRFNPYKDIPYKCIIKGDGKYTSIAAASILAKTHRDQLMLGYHESYPQYGWKANKGYPTKSHREAIAIHGPTSLHRGSFRLLPDQLQIPFD